MREEKNLSPSWIPAQLSTLSNIEKGFRWSSRWMWRLTRDEGTIKKRKENRKIKYRYTSTEWDPVHMNGGRTASKDEITELDQSWLKAIQGWRLRWDARLWLHLRVSRRYIARDGWRLGHRREILAAGTRLLHYSRPQLSNLRWRLRPRLRDVTATKELVFRIRTALNPSFLCACLSSSFLLQYVLLDIFRDIFVSIILSTTINNHQLFQLLNKEKYNIVDTNNLILK